MDKKIILAHIAMFMVAFFYASNFTIAKPVMAGATPYISPTGFIMLRASFAAVLFFLLHTLFIREKVERGDWWRLALCGVCGVAGNQLFFFKGLQLTTPINGALIMLTTPILVLVVSSFVFKEKLTLLKIGGISMGIVGAVILILGNPNNIQDAPNPTLGNIFIGINAVFYSCYLILVKPLMTKYSPFTVLKWVFLSGAIYCIPFGWEGLMEIDWQTMPTNILWSVAYVLFFVTFMTYILNGSALKVVKPSVNSTYIYLQPLLASIIAIAAGKDSLSISILLAGGFIFAGVFMVAKKEKASKTINEDVLDA